MRVLSRRRVDLAPQLLGVGVDLLSISLLARVTAFWSCSSIFDSPKRAEVALRVPVGAATGQLRRADRGRPVEAAVASETAPQVSRDCLNIAGRPLD